MQVDQEDQKLQAGDSEDKKAEADEMEVHVHQDLTKCQVSILGMVEMHSYT